MTRHHLPGFRSILRRLRPSLLRPSPARFAAAAALQDPELLLHLQAGER